jgi:DnaJ family protein C protein 28
MPNIEELLRQAIAEGKFDNLPGKGKPLQLDADNPYSDQGWELAYKILRDAGYSLPWIETIREIEADIESARSDLRRAWEWHQAARVESNSPSSALAEWQRAQAAFMEKVTALNQCIRNYNLDVPNARFQRPVLIFEHELQKVTSS